MLRRLFPIVAIAFTACVFPWGECLDEDSASSGPEARCSPEVSRALRVLDDAHRGLWEFLPHWPPGEVSGEVISADERRLQIGIEGELRTLTWPHELPFAVDVGEPVAIRVGHESVTLLFEGGTLSYHAGAGFSGPGEVHIGELAVQWESDEYGCASDRGAALNLLVGETRIAPGERRTIREWTFTNLGAFSTAGEERCGTVVEGSYVGAWMAERPNGVQECFGPPMQGEPCGESVAALLQGEAFAPESWTAHEGPYTVSEVEEDSFRLFPAGPHDDAMRTFRWPGPLPIPMLQGDTVEVERRDDWLVLRFPTGRLAFFSDAGFTFEPPTRGLDETTSIALADRCVLDEHRSSVSIQLQLEAMEPVQLWPGMEAPGGDYWFYRFVYAEERSPLECHSPEGVLLIEGSGRGTIVAYRPEVQ